MFVANAKVQCHCLFLYKTLLYTLSPIHCGDGGLGRTGCSQADTCRLWGRPSTGPGERRGAWISRVHMLRAHRLWWTPPSPRRPAAPPCLAVGLSGSPQNVRTGARLLAPTLSAFVSLLWRRGRVWELAAAAAFRGRLRWCSPPVVRRPFVKTGAALLQVRSPRYAVVPASVLPNLTRRPWLAALLV